MYKPVRGEMISSDFEFQKTADELIVKKYFGNRKVVYVKPVLDIEVTTLSIKSFENNNETSIIILDKNIRIIEKDAFFGLEDVVVYTPLSIKDADFNNDYNENVLFRYGLEGIVDNEYVLYAYFNTGIATIFDHHTMDILHLSEGRYGEFLQLEDMINNRPVTIIEPYAMSHSFNIERFTLPKHCHKISKYAFFQATSLVSIWTNEELQEIDSFAFSSNRNLREIIIDSSVKKIGNSILHNSPIATIYAMNVTEIEKGINFNSGRPIYDHFEEFEFQNGIDYALLSNMIAIVCDGAKSNVKELEIPTRLSTKKGDYIVKGVSAASFKGNKSIKDIVFGTTIDDLGDSCLEDSVVERIIIKGNVKIIPADFCNNTEYLEKVVLPKGLEMILDRAFFYSFNLKSISLPNSLVVMGSQCFSNSGLKSLVLPKKLRSLEEDVLMCTDITHLVIPKSVQKVTMWSLGAMTELRTIVIQNENMQVIGDVLTEFNDVTIFCEGQNEKLRDIFSKMSNGRIRFITGLSDIIEQNGLIYGLFQNSEIALLGYDEEKLQGNIEINDSISGIKVTTMCDYCLFKTSIKEIYIPDSIKIIGDNTLKNSSLIKLRLPYNIKPVIEHWISGNVDVIISDKKEIADRKGEEKHV